MEEVKEKTIVKMYHVQDIANYNRTVTLDNGHVIKFIEFDTEVAEEDILYFKRHSDFQVGNWREVIFEELSEKAIKDAPAPIIIHAQGLMHGVSGFAEAMRNVTYSLHKKGFVVIAHPTDPPDADGVQIQKTEKGKVINRLSHVRYTMKEDHPVVSIQMTVPDGIRKKGNMYTIAYVMFETVDFPKRYTQFLQTNADEIWTPSSFNVENITRSGWTRPIFRMPLGVDTVRFDPTKHKPFEPEEAQIGQYKDKFIFLTIMGWSERKGVAAMLEAYLKEFSASEDVLFYMKGGWYSHDRANQEVSSAIQDFNSHDTPLITTDFRIYTDQEHPRLYKSADAFILASRGEGWGLNYTEAMSMELPTLGTAATSMTDFMDDTNSFPIAVKNFVPESRANWISNDYVGALFANPDIDSMRKQMRFVFENRVKAKAVAKKGRQDMITKWSWNSASEMYTERLKELAKKL